MLGAEEQSSAAHSAPLPGLNPPQAKEVRPCYPQRTPSSTSSTSTQYRAWRIRYLRRRDVWYLRRRTTGYRLRTTRPKARHRRYGARDAGGNDGPLRCRPPSRRVPVAARKPARDNQGREARAQGLRVEAGEAGEHGNARRRRPVPRKVAEQRGHRGLHIGASGRIPHGIQRDEAGVAILRFRHARRPG